jgi:hypothetical protein
VYDRVAILDIGLVARMAAGGKYQRFKGRDRENDKRGISLNC